MKKATALCMLTLLLFGTRNVLHGQDFAPVGIAVAQFLEIGVGARAAGLGEAYTTITDDAGSVFWNPAGLADNAGISLYTAYNLWPADISVGGVSFSMNLGRSGVFALSSVFLMTDDMEVTSISHPNGTGEFFNISNTSFGLSYARYLTDRVSVGVTGKLVRENYWEYGYSTWAVDIGTLYRTSFHGLKLGMSILHFGPEVRFSGDYIDYSDPLSYAVDSSKTFETYSLPINFRIGTSFHILNTGNHLLTVAADMVHPNNNLEQYNLGVEYSFGSNYFLRGGYKLVTDEGGLCFGMGAVIHPVGSMGIKIDYAFSNLGILTNSHQFTLVLSL
ncbi:PorV/PorQ family protein [Candidatus Neomarinimicrobiota bacterium]